MGYIKSALEIALEKTAGEKLTPQEIAEIKQQKKIDSILAKYYKDRIKAEQLWHHFKELPGQYLMEAQNSFLRSLTFQSSPYDVGKRETGILALESLKKSKKSSEIEHYFKQLVKSQEGFQKEKEGLIKSIEKDLENNPERRMQTFQQGNQIIIKELTVQEVMEQDEGLKEKLNQMEKKYIQKFNLLKEKMVELIKENN
jgi:hypothetical protein